MKTTELRNLYCDIKATFGNVGNKKEKYLNALAEAINYIDKSVEQNSRRNMQIKELRNYKEYVETNDERIADFQDWKKAFNR